MDDKQNHPSSSGEMQSSTPVQDERAVFRKRVLKSVVQLLSCWWGCLHYLFLWILKITGSDR